MNEQDLRKELEVMSTWTGGQTRLWQRALEAERAEEVRGAGAWWTAPLGWARSPRVAAVMVGAVGMVVLLMSVMGGGGGATRSGTPRGSFEADRRSASVNHADATMVARDLDRARKQAKVDLAYEERQQRFTADLYRAHVAGSVGRDALVTIDAPSVVDPLTARPDHILHESSDPLTIVRQVAYSASVSLRSSNVRMVSDRIRTLADPTRDEFVDSVTVGGEGGSAIASIVLRIRSERLDEVLSALRGMGDLVSESVAAEDLTTRLVDVGARLRNERRVEAELLELVSSREGLDLEGLVMLRRELGGVRERIEQMESQLAGMNRMVALSTVRVSVQGRDATPRTESGWQRFRQGLGEAWSGGLRTLESSVQRMLAFVVGRVVWWMPGLVLLIVAWRTWKRGGR